MKQLTPEQRNKIAAEVNIECLGTAPAAVWLSHADPRLAALARQAAVATTLPVKWVNVEKGGRDDTEPFGGLHLPTITFHSITQETFPVLRSARDNLSAIHPDDYYASYRLLAYYLAFIDQRLGAKPDTTVR